MSIGNLVLERDELSFLKKIFLALIINNHMCALYLVPIFEVMSTDF